MLNITQIPAPRVPFLDERTGTISREWFRFLNNLFVLTGGGTNQFSITDLQLGPPVQTDPTTASAVADLALAPSSSTQESQIAELEKQVQALASAPPANTQTLWSNVIVQPKIEAYDSSASIALTSTPTLLKPASTVTGASGIVYDAATGEFTFSAAGSYSLSLSVNATASAANQFVYIYAENNTNGTWVVNANSGKSYELSNANTVQIVYSQSIGRVAGQKVRYWIYSNDGKVNLTTQTLPGGVGAIVPAIRIQYS